MSGEAIGAAAPRPRCLVTGVAGFIGSNLAAHLLDAGHPVVGVDSFTGYYPRSVKEENLAALRGRERFSFREMDLCTAELGPLLRGVDTVFHHAAQPGVRASWGSSFRPYVENNVGATQRLIEAARGLPLRRFVFASSSSIYGDARDLPVAESALPQPISPYGVTKLAAEHLCALYARVHQVPTVSLRYFTVYGPGQRPDMAFHRFIRGILEDGELSLYGDGEQTRDFTFIGDVVQGAVAAAEAAVGAPWGRVYNIGGGTRASMNSVIDVLQSISGRTARVKRLPPQPGDVRHTYADCSAARADLDYRPASGLAQGLKAQVDWQLASRALERVP